MHFCVKWDIKAKLKRNIVHKSQQQTLSLCIKWNVTEAINLINAFVFTLRTLAWLVEANDSLRS